MNIMKSFVVCSLVVFVGFLSTGCGTKPKTIGSVKDKPKSKDEIDLKDRGKRNDQKSDILDYGLHFPQSIQPRSFLILQARNANRQVIDGPLLPGLVFQNQYDFVLKKILGYDGERTLDQEIIEKITKEKICPTPISRSCFADVLLKRNLQYIKRYKETTGKHHPIDRDMVVVDAARTHTTAQLEALRKVKDLDKNKGFCVFWFFHIGVPTLNEHLQSSIRNYLFMLANYKRNQSAGRQELFAELVGIKKIIGKKTVAVRKPIYKLYFQCHSKDKIFSMDELIAISGKRFVKALK